MKDYSGCAENPQQELQELPEEYIRQKFTPKKHKALFLADSFERIASVTHDPWFFDRAKAVGDCANSVFMLRQAEGQSDSGASAKHRVLSAFFCKKRLCPMCDWRRSLNLCSQLTDIFTVLSVERPSVRFAFLSLTIRNMTGEEFPAAIDQIQKGFRALLRRYRKRLSDVLGGFRSLEVTINPDDGTFHPHLHAVLALNSSYYKGTGYITQAEWADMWRDVLSLDYTPSTFINNIKTDEHTDNETKAHEFRCTAAEVAKYCVKSADYLLPNDLEETDRRVAVLAPALHHRRLVNMWGLIKDYHKRLNLCDPDTIPPLATLGGKAVPVLDDVLYFVVGYRWGKGEYSQCLESQKPATLSEIRARFFGGRSKKK